MTLSRRVFALVVAASAGLGCLVGAAPGASAVSPARPGDFNGDGYPDLAVSAPGAIVNGYDGAGVVAIVYGTATGLDTTKRQRLQQGVSWVPGAAGTDENFGADHVSADLNGDGYSDLAICAPGENRDGTHTGALMLAFGSANGLNRAYELEPPVLGPTIAEYCRGLASGDFDADGYPDLAVKSGQYYKAPIEIISGGPDAGFRSKLEKIAITPPAIPGELSAGDITGDGYADLVVGATWRSTTGGLTLYKGSAAGLGTTPAQLVSTPGSAYTAVGDVDGDGFADVAASNTEVGPSGVRYAGLVRLWFGSRGGLDTARGFTLITQDTPGVPDVVEPGDRFGRELAIGDADGDGYAELAIHAIEDIGTSSGGWDAGTITVLYGKAGGLDFSRRNHLSQDSPGIPDQVEPGDNFGSSLLFRDFSRTPDGRSDLVAGTPLENGSLQEEGATFALKSTSAGLSGRGAVMFGPRQLGIAPAWAYFGALT